MDARKQRGKDQHMYLLSCERAHDHWFFHVQGASGKEYKIMVRRDVVPICTCPDFKIRKNVCKHFFFVVAQVAGDLSLFERISQNLTTEQYDLLDLLLTKRLNENRHGEKREGNDRGDEFCSICTIDFDENEGEEHYDPHCHECRHKFHYSCIQQWLRINRTCPLCRSKWPVTWDEKVSPLHAFKQFVDKTQDLDDVRDDDVYSCCSGDTCS